MERYARTVFGGTDDFRETRDALSPGAVQVLLVVGLGRAHERGDVPDVGVDGPLQPAAVRDEGPQAEVFAGGEVAEAGQDGLGICELGNPRRLDEGGDLDVAHAGIHETPHELYFVVGGDNDCFVLQAVARGHFVDAHSGRASIGKLSAQLGDVAFEVVASLEAKVGMCHVDLRTVLYGNMPHFGSMCGLLMPP